MKISTTKMVLIILVVIWIWFSTDFNELIHKPSMGIKRSNTEHTEESTDAAQYPRIVNDKSIADTGQKEEPPIAAVGDTITIVATANGARLCPHIDCGQDLELLRLPTGTKLTVESSSTSHLPLWEVVWYKVKYKGRQGWVSEFSTDKAPKEQRY